MVEKLGSLGGALVGVGSDPRASGDWAHPTPSAVRSAVSELGRPVMRYTRPFADRALIRLFVAVSLELFAALLLVGPEGVLRAPLTVTLLLAGLVIVVRTVFVRPLDLRVHAYGFALLRGRSAPVIAPYAAIASVRARGLEAGERLELIIELGDGRSVRLSSSDSPFRSAAEAILGHARAVITPRVAADYLSGVDLDFRRLQVRNGKLFFGDRVFALADIETATVDRKHLVITTRRDRKHIRVPSFEVANLEALLSLLSRVASGPKHRPARTTARRGGLF